MLNIHRLNERTLELRDSSKSTEYWVGLSRFLASCLADIEEVLNTEDSTVIIFPDCMKPDIHTIENLTSRFTQDQGLARNKRKIIEIETKYSVKGTELQSVAVQLGLSADEVIAIHTSQVYQIAMFGFMPGFAYLSGVPPQLYLRRKSNPSFHVPAGSVAIAESYTGIYPARMQGGWHVIGHTSFRFFGQDGIFTPIVEPGDLVKFVSR